MLRVQTFLLMAVLCSASTMAASAEQVALGADAKGRIEADWLRQERVIWKRDADSAAALEGVLQRGGRMAGDLRMLGAEDAAEVAAAILNEVAAAREKLLRDQAANGPRWRALYLRARGAVRELAFANPALDFDELLFVKRQWPSRNHQCSHRVGEAQIPGANLCVLKGLAPDGAVRELLGAARARGGIGRPGLSFDAKRIVFPYAAPRVGGSRKYGYGEPGVRGGRCLMYDVYEIGVDGAGWRNLTRSPDSEDTEPIYLPDGRIAFMSSRANRYVQCGDWALVCGVYGMNQDGGDVRQITEPKEGEFYPGLLDDGRIVYTRWDYLMKGYNVIQQLWAVNPDGTKAQLVFGDWFAFSVGPIGLYEARQIPGTSQLIAVGAAHHNTGVGPVVIVDLDQNRGTRAGMRNVTPQLHYPEIKGGVLREVCREEAPGRGGSNTHGDAGWYSSPYPLTEKHFLVCYSFEGDNAAPHGYGLYLQDVHGNQELIYRGAGWSCYSPMPLRPGTPPPAIPSAVEDAAPSAPATFFVSDVYQGLPGVESGAVKFLRVLETLPKVERTTPQRCDVGVNSGWDMRAVLGTVSVEADGSAHFSAPANRQLFFEALDGDYLEIRRMRNFTNAMPGETVGCVGCHEPQSTAPTHATPGRPLALRRSPSKIAPPPWGAGGFSFARVVQPVLDKQCARCHDGAEREEHSFDLRGEKLVAAPAPYDRDQGPQHGVSDSFLALLKYVSYIRVGGYQGEKLPLPPNATGSRRSRLMQLLKAGHYDVALELGEWRTLAAWIDCNAPFYGSWDEIVLAPEAAKPGDARLLRALTEEDGRRIAARKAELQKALPPGERLGAYLDCGLQLKDGASDGPRLTLIQGKGYDYGASPGARTADRCITFDGHEILFSAEGLGPGKRYGLSITWWDFNANGRRQSVWASAGKIRERLLPATLLPNWERDKQRASQVTLELPAVMVDAGKCQIAVRNEGGANAVLGELWLVVQPPR